MCKAIDYFVFRLMGDIPQHPFEFQDNGLGDDDVARCEQVGGNAALHIIVVQVIASNDWASTGLP